MTETTQLDAAEIQLFRDNIVRFLQKEVEPYFEQWEKDEIFPRELWNKLGEAGLLCVDVPEEFGGFGSDFELSAIVTEELGRGGYGALAASVSVHSDIVTPYIFRLGTEEQKMRWLPGMVTGEVVGAIAMTEPGTGSDLGALRTQAVREGNDFVINGQKTFITNGQHCDVVVTATKTDPSAGVKGITLVTVDCSLPGFNRGRNLQKMGLHSGDTSELFYDNVRVTEGDILGGENQGFFNMMKELPRERLIIAVIAVGAAKGMLERTVEYVLERKAFGQSIASFQNTRFKLAELKTEIELNYAMVEKYIGRYNAGELTAEEASMSKLAATEMQGRVADACLQLFGGYGYMMEYPISRSFVDARIQRIYGGTSEIMKEIIARSLVGR